MSNITLYEGWSFDQLRLAGQDLGKSAMLGFTRAEQGIILMMEARALGKTPMQVMRKIHITENGRILMRADAMLADFRALGGKVKWIEHSTTRVAGEVDFDGQKTIVEYTIQTAQSAGYVKVGSNWAKDPESALQAAWIRKMVRMLAPEVIVESGDPDNEFQPERKTLQLAPVSSATEVSAVCADAEAGHCAKLIDEIPDVIAKQQDEKAEAESGLAPIEKPVDAPPIAIGDPALLTDEMVAAVQDAIGGYGPEAGAWFLREGWLQPGQGIEHLKLPQAKKIIGQQTSFIRAITGAAK